MQPAVLIMIIHTLQIMGAVIAFIGICIFFDMGNFATILGLSKDDLNTIIGGALIIVGVLDVLILPRILQVKINNKK